MMVALLGEGITRVQRVHFGGAHVEFSIDDPIGMVKYFMNGGEYDGIFPLMRENDLLHITYVEDGRFKEVLTRKAYDDPTQSLRVGEIGTRPMVVFLNGINVTRFLQPIMNSFREEHALTVRDVAAFLIFNKCIDASDVALLALRTQRMELTFIDHDLDEIVFRGGSTVVDL